MLDQALMEKGLAALPLYTYHFLPSQALEFADRVRWVCEQACPMYGRTWACPPGVGSVTECEARCRQYGNCLMISTVTEVADITDIPKALETRAAHEQITDQVRELFREQRIEPYILSTEACAICERCAYEDGEPCRHPQRMHPCVESHGINLLPLLETLGLAFQYGENVITWFSLLFY